MNLKIKKTLVKRCVHGRYCEILNIDKDTIKAFKMLV